MESENTCWPYVIPKCTPPGPCLPKMKPVSSELASPLLSLHSVNKQQAGTSKPSIRMTRLLRTESYRLPIRFGIAMFNLYHCLEKQNITSCDAWFLINPTNYDCFLFQMKLNRDSDI